MSLVWRDDGPGERRACIVEQGEIVEAHIDRAHDLKAGAQGLARLVEISPNGSFLMAESGQMLLIPSRIAKPLGSYHAFEIVREAIPEPGQIKCAKARLMEGELQPANLDPWEARLAHFAPSIEKPGAMDDVIDIALAGTIHIGDAQIHFQRTKAGLVFDVDGSGDPHVLNMAAAEQIARLLRLFQVGGNCLIDFIGMGNKADRNSVAEAFDAAAQRDPRPFERTAINGFGLMQVVRPRLRPSLLDQLFGTRIASLSDETQGLQLLRDAARINGYGPRLITANPAIIALIESPAWQSYRATAEAKAGAPINLIADSALRGYGHVHVSQA